MPRIHFSASAFISSWPLAVMLVMAAQWSAAAGTHDGLAVPGVFRFDLSAQPLALSLAAFGGITGYSVLVSSAITSGKQAAAVSGDMSPDEALSRLLVGTHLAPSHIGPRAVTLVPVSAMDAREATPAAADSRADAGDVAPTPHAAYLPVLQASITRQLCNRQPRIFGRYRVGVQLWVDSRGAVRRVHLLGSSGTPVRDAAVSAHLGSLVMDQPPPPELAQPLAILLTPRPDPVAECRSVGAMAGGG